MTLKYIKYNLEIFYSLTIKKLTTLIWRKLSNWTLQLAWDKRMTDWFGMYRDTSTKVIQLDNILLGKAWDSLSVNLIKELYKLWKKEMYEWINSILEAIDFYNFVKKNCNIKNINNENLEPNISFIILHKDFQIQIDNNWQVSELTNDWILTIWSWSSIASTLHWICKEWKFKTDLELNDYFDLVSSMDNSTSKKYDLIQLLPEILIQTN